MTSVPDNATFSSLLVDVRERYSRRRPRSHDAMAQGAKYMPGGNTRSVLYYPPFPIFAESSAGCRLRDIDGHSYVDFLCEYTAGLAGHDHPAIRAAVEGVLARGWVNGAQTEMEGRLAGALCERFPSIERIRFCNSGTEANLMALTTARVLTGRSAIMAFKGAYHGGVLLFKSGASPQNAPFETVLADYNDVESTRQLISRCAATLAAVIIEPLMGASGGIPAEPEFLRMLREECTRHGITLIFDEVMTSRLAPGGLQEKHGISPDLTTLGKYLGGGFSFGAFGGRADIMDRYDPSRTDALSHAGTFNNNPFTMAAGLAVVTGIYTRERAIAFNEAGDRLRARLQAQVAERELCLRFIGIGSMMAIHVASGAVRRPADSRADLEAAAAKDLLHLELIERGYYTARRGMIVLSLPMTQIEHDGLVAAYGDILDEYAPAFRRLATATCH